MNNLTTLRPITLEEARKYRGEQRAFYGYDVTIPFFGREIVPAGGSYVMVSKKIPLRFELKEIEVFFPSGVSRLLEVYIYVDNDNIPKMKGYNPLAKYSDTPYLVGDNKVILARINGQEFEENKYIKIGGINRGIYPYSIDARIHIVCYPNL